MGILALVGTRKGLVPDLLSDERGEWNRYLNVYVNGTDAPERGGVACPLAGARKVRVMAHIVGG